MCGSCSRSQKLSYPACYQVHFSINMDLILLQSERPKLYTVLAFRSAIGLNDLRIIICLRKSEVTVENISVCNVIEKLMEHGIHCLPCSGTNDVIDLLP